VGGHSLKATALMLKIYKEFNIKVSLEEIFEAPTLRRLAESIKSKKQEEYISIQPAEKRDYYALASAQKRLYILHQMDEGCILYNMPSVMILEGPLDSVKLDEAFNKLIKRHESLRTSFEMIENEPLQRIYNKVAFAVEYLRLEEVHTLATLSMRTNDEPQVNEGKIEKIILNFVRPFDLTQPPLLRVEMIRVEQQKYILMLDMHHIISDGVSLGIFEKEIAALYRGENLPELRIQYKDFSEWQNSRRGREFIKKHESYWLKVFSNRLRRLDMPPDYPRVSAGQTFDGNVIEFELGEELTKRLKEMASRKEVTLYMVLLAVYNVLLSKYSGQEDIVVGTPVSGRTQVDLDHIIGMFVNILAIRNYPEGKKTFKEFLQQVKSNSLEAFNNQDYQFELLLQSLNLDREVGRNPLVETTFVVQNMERSQLRMEGLTFVPYPFQNKTAKFEMVLEAEEQEKKINFLLQYAAKLHKKESMKLFCDHYLEIINTVVRNDEVKLMDIELTSFYKSVEIMEDRGQQEDKFEFDF
jgi:hypothetical protein